MVMIKACEGFKCYYFIDMVQSMLSFWFHLYRVYRSWCFGGKPAVARPNEKLAVVRRAIFFGFLPEAWFGENEYSLHPSRKCLYFETRYNEKAWLLLARAFIKLFELGSRGCTSFGVSSSPICFRFKLSLERTEFE